MYVEAGDSVHQNFLLIINGNLSRAYCSNIFIHVFSKIAHINLNFHVKEVGENIRVKILACIVTKHTFLVILDGKSLKSSLLYPGIRPGSMQ